ncbi:MAG: NUDIX hydrolase [Myxococcaceae bacterium]|nr:NUDIX hydrolase [Myxococcaceae bacterium]
MASRIAPWSVVAEHRRLDLHIFTLRELTLKDPRDGREHPRVTLECPDWVNVVALTDDRRVVLVRQFRAGILAPTLEIPGGMVDPGEAPATAAARELEEETGFRPAKLVPLGVCHPNPALQDNRLHTYLATGCVQVHGGRPDHGEDLELVVVPEAELGALVARGEISHALVLSAFYFAGLGRPVG